VLWAGGTSLLLAAPVGGLSMGYRLAQLVLAYGRTLWLVRYSLTTIVLMLASGTLTRYCGLDTAFGLAFAGPAALYLLFGTLMG